VKICDCKENKNKTDVEIKNKVTNLGIKCSAEKPCSELGAIASALYEIQYDTCSIAKAVDVWKQMKTNFSSEDRKKNGLVQSKLCNTLRTENATELVFLFKYLISK
jgi:hypothetical protein